MTYNVEYYLQVSGKEMLEQRNRPFLQCFREYGMVRIPKDLLGHLPGFVPRDVFLVDEYAHKLGHRDGRVSLHRKVSGSGAFWRAKQPTSFS